MPLSVTGFEHGYEMGRQGLGEQGGGVRERWSTAKPAGRGAEGRRVRAGSRKANSGTETGVCWSSRSSCTGCLRAYRLSMLTKRREEVVWNRLVLEVASVFVGPTVLQKEVAGRNHVTDPFRR